MTTIRVIAGAAAAALVAAALLACGGSAEAGPKTDACSPASPCTNDGARHPDSGWSEQHVKLRDGRTITCVTHDNGTGYGGISCDWNAR